MKWSQQKGEQDFIPFGHQRPWGFWFLLHLKLCSMHTGSTHLLQKSNCSFSKMEGPNICWKYWSCISQNEMLLRHKWCVIWNLPSSMWGRDPNLYCIFWNHHLWLVVHPRWSPQHSSLARKKHLNLSWFQKDIKIGINLWWTCWWFSRPLGFLKHHRLDITLDNTDLTRSLYRYFNPYEIIPSKMFPLRVSEDLGWDARSLQNETRSRGRWNFGFGFSWCFQDRLNSSNFWNAPTGKRESWNFSEWFDSI